jgi:uncharacterized protein (TIGR00299 family) protein
MDLYFDCFSGISGDMTVGALIDLGVPVEWLAKNLKSLFPGKRLRLETETTSRNGIRAVNFTVHEGDSAPARDYAAIRSLLSGSSLPQRATTAAGQIFEAIARAESRIHGVDLDHVHFHEVGGVDAIVDIVGTALCFDYLSVRRAVFSPLPLGSGFVTCSHGRLPVPAPATVEILAGVPVTGSDLQGELVTPTGAAIAATLADHFGTLPDMRIEATGYGAGDRDLAPHPNLLRILSGRFSDEPAATADDRICQLETAIDDMNPEIFSYAMERLFEEGAIDVCWFPVYMKKNRPGTMVQVICHPDDTRSLAHVLLSETTSIGVRFQKLDRMVLPRKQSTRDTRFGPVTVKTIGTPDGKTRWTPEYETCKGIAKQYGLSLRDVYEQILRDGHDSSDVETIP